MSFTFNRSYDDLEQVAEFLPQFIELHKAELDAGRYPYNDSFKGEIAGIAGDSEDTAIYLLQGLYRKRKQDAKVAALLAEGYTHLEAMVGGLERFRHVVLYPTRQMGGEWAEYHDARILDVEGVPSYVLPKGKRTRGHLIMGRAVLVTPAQGERV